MQEIDSEPKNQQMIVYGHKYCAQATLLARTLAKYEIDHEWRDIREGGPNWQEELRRLARGYLSVPTVVFPDGTVMVEPWPRQVLQKMGIQEEGFLNRLLGR